MKLAVLGASSSIFRSLQPHLESLGCTEVQLFSRIVRREGYGELAIQSLSNFQSTTEDFDLVLNFIGTGNPLLDEVRFSALVKASIAVDGFAMEKLKVGTVGRYVHLSSGVAQWGNGDDFDSSYANLKAFLERRHQESGLSIVDIRVFGFADKMGSFFKGALVGDLYQALQLREVFETDTNDVVRDYCGAQELNQLLGSVLAQPQFCGAIELFSLAPVTKMQLLTVLAQFGMQISWRDSATPQVLTGQKSVYVPTGRLNPLDYAPTRTSLEVVMDALGIGYR